MALLFAPVVRAKADTGEQNAIEAVCMYLLLSDYAYYGVVPLARHFDAYMVCGLAWWISWLPEPLQERWWRWQYDRATNVLGEAIKAG